MKGKRRIFNFRPLVAIFFALVAGLLIGEALYGESLYLMVVPLSAGVIPFIFLCVFKRARKFALIPLALLVGFAAITASNAVYDANVLYVDHTYRSKQITAKVDSEIVFEPDYVKFYVTDIYVDGQRLRYDGTVCVYFDFDPDFNAGDIIAMDAYIEGEKHVKFDGEHAAAIANGRAYYLDPVEFYKVAEGRPNIIRRVQLFIKKMFDQNMESQTAMIAKALVLGDKFGIDPLLNDNVAASGLAHVLAVSGLHITTLASALYFLLKKVKMKPAVSLLIVSIFTFLYAMLCSFTASALRAFVMCAVFHAAAIFGKKKDNVSTCSLAAILILLFRPTAFMELGFLLSFSSMFGIFLFHKSFYGCAMKIVDRVSPKRHIGKRVADLVCVTLSATAMSYPFVAYIYGKLPIMMLLSNVVFVPYIMVVYVALLFMTVFAAATTLHSSLLVINVLLFPFKKYVNWVGGLPVNAVLLPPITVAGIVAYLLIAIFLSRFNLMPKKDKLRGGLILVSSAAVVCAALALI